MGSSDKLPGLTTEEANLKNLIQKLKIMVPKFLNANGLNIDYETPFEVITRHFEIARQQVI